MKLKHNKLRVFAPNNIFIGTDIVSRTDTDNIKSFNNQRYLKKFLNTNELLYLDHPFLNDFIPPLIWSCKECAIKILFQKNYKRGFAPLLFEVKISQIIKQEGALFYQIISTVNFDKYRMYCKSEISHDYIISFACNKKSALNDVTYAIEKTDIKGNAKLSKRAYGLLKESISSYYALAQTKLKVIKDENGKPELFYKNKYFNIPFSISHDGNFISFAFFKNELPER